ncbi:MAG TPA: peptidase M1 [Bacteroidales bacterium]|nr:peptidase M1 [Bacteroidales bacterium]
MYAMKNLLIALLFVYSSTGMFANFVGVAGLNFDVKYHKVFWEIDPSSRYIKGNVYTELQYTADNVSHIKFDFSSALTVNAVISKGEELDFTTGNNVLSITLKKVGEKSFYDSLTIYYQGAPTTSGFGAFEQSYHSGSPIVWTLSEPYGAMEWWPCKQDLVDKIDSIDIYVKTPKVNKVASNGVLIAEDVVGDFKTVHWKHRHPIAAYLVAIAVTNYVEYSDYVNLTGGRKLQILNYVYPESLEYAKANTPNLIPIIELYNRLFIEYPFSNEKYGHAQFGWGGGMEHQTMTFLGGFEKMLLAHEAAHQWFGDHVTCGSWADIWVNEGFATYLEGLSCEHGLGEQTWLAWKTGKISSVTSQTYGSLFVTDTMNINTVFSSRLSYNKGAMVLHTLRKLVGDEQFFAACQNYLNDPVLKAGYAKTADVQRHFEAVSGRNLTKFFADWVYGQGYPVFDIKYKHKSATELQIEVSQTSTHSSVDYFECKIPIKLQNSSQFKIVELEIQSKTQVFTIPIDFSVSSVVFDPNKDVISRNSVITMAAEMINNSNIILFPNPAKSVLTLSNLSNFNLSKLEITDLNGKIVYFKDTLGTVSEFNIEISSFAKGIYLLKIKTDEKLNVFQFVKD